MGPKRATPAFDEIAHRRAFGDRVRHLRRDRGWTQEQLAEAAGMDRSFLADVERGVRNPTLDTIHRLALGLGISPAEFFPPDDVG
jgi:transcriptional regulator with XRE-family HTH domain